MGDQNPSFKAPPSSLKGGGKGDIRRGTIEKIWCVWVIERKEVRKDDQIEYFSQRESEVSVEGQRWL